MNGRRRARQQGVALVLVLIALTVLTAVTAEIMESNQVYLTTATNERDALQAEYLARSGVNLSRLLLSVQPILGKSVNFPFWQYADMALQLFSDPGGLGLGSDRPGGGGAPADGGGTALGVAKGLGVGPGTFTVQILDEDSKINVNWPADPVARGRLLQQLAMLIAPEVYDPLFERRTASGDFISREDVACEILDWTDADLDLCDNSGSEDPTFYQALPVPYERKNAPFDSLEELHLLRGIDDDFWATFVDPDPRDPDARVLTVWGKGRVNVNTAPAQVLFPIVCMLATDESGVGPCLDPLQRYNLLTILQAIVSLRTFMPFAKARDFVATIENPEEKLFLPLPGVPLPGRGLARQLLGTRSTVFSITAEGTAGKVTKRITAVVDTEGVDMLDPTKSVAAAGGSVLYWRME